MNYYKYTLGWPPTTNLLWRHSTQSGRGVTYRSRVYKDFLKDSSEYFRTCNIKTITSPVSVILVYYSPDKRKYDVDNKVKAVFDVMTHAGIWEDDSQVVKFTAIKGPTDKYSPRVEIIIETDWNNARNNYEGADDKTA